MKLKLQPNATGKLVFHLIAETGDEELALRLMNDAPGMRLISNLSKAAVLEVTVSSHLPELCTTTGAHLLLAQLTNGDTKRRAYFKSEGWSVKKFTSKLSAPDGSRFTGTRTYYASVYQHGPHQRHGSETRSISEARLALTLLGTGCSNWNDRQITPEVLRDAADMVDIPSYKRTLVRTLVPLMEKELNKNGQ